MRNGVGDMERKSKTVLIELSDEEIYYLKKCALRLGFGRADAKKTRRTGSLKDAVSYAAQICARVEKEFDKKK